VRWCRLSSSCSSSWGGELRLESEITEIMTKDNQVTGVMIQDGQRAPFERVVSDADVFHTYDVLLRQTGSAAGMRRRLGKMSYSMSLFPVYFGTNKKFSNLVHHNIIFGPGIASFCLIFLSEAFWLTTFRSICTCRRVPIRRWPRRIAKLFMFCLRASFGQGAHRLGKGRPKLR
jgi:hypothetical protein